MKRPSFYKHLWSECKDSWKGSSTKTTLLVAFGVLLAAGGGAAFAWQLKRDQSSGAKSKGSQSGSDSGSSCFNDDDDVDVDDDESSKSYSDGYAKGMKDGFWANPFDASNYASNEKKYESGYCDGFQDGQSKDSV